MKIPWILNTWVVPVVPSPGATGHRGRLLREAVAAAPAAQERHRSPRGGGDGAALAATAA